MCREHGELFRFEFPAIGSATPLMSVGKTQIVYTRMAGSKERFTCADMCLSAF